MQISRPLDNYPLARTRSVEAARKALGRVYAKPTLTPAGGAKSLNAAINDYKFKHVGLGFATYGAVVNLKFPDTRFCIQLFPIQGEGRIVIGAISSRLFPGKGIAIASSVGFQVNYTADYQHLILRMDAVALLQKLSAIVGEPVSNRLEITSTCDFSSPMARMLHDYVLFLVKQLTSARSPLPSWATDESEQLLMMLFLFANNHNYSHLLHQKPSDIGHWQARRAAAYIEANWSKPITLENLAAVTGSSTRSLFRTFRGIYGCTPLEFAKRVRLVNQSKI